MQPRDPYYESHDRHQLGVVYFRELKYFQWLALNLPYAHSNEEIRMLSAILFNLCNIIRNQIQQL